MSNTTPGQYIHHYPKGFRKRRGLNWTALGFMYAGYYMCRYNFRIAAPGIKDEFGFTNAQIGDMWAIWAIAYGTGQLINGLITDRIGGRRAMLTGAVATIIINLIFGFSSLVSSFTTMSLIWLVNGYFQAFGAPSMVKTNAAWFQRNERGLFSGIFGGMIQLGKFGISTLGPWILSGMPILGHLLVADGQWRLLFILPPVTTAAAAVFLAFCVKESPDDAGYPGIIHDEIDNSDGVTIPMGECFRKIFTHPLVWFYALAYASTGAVRHTSDLFVGLYFINQLGMDMDHLPTLARSTLGLEAVVAVIGSLLSGFISDKYFKGRRAPVALTLYAITTVVLIFSALLLENDLVGPTALGIWIGCSIVLLISFSVNSTHSLVGAAAPMDIGGKKMAGFASGVIDSFQYYGGAIALIITGRVLDATEEKYGYLFWFIIMAGFGLLGVVAMWRLIVKQKRTHAIG